MTILYILITLLIVIILLLSFALYYFAKKSTYISDKEKEFIIFVIDIFEQYGDDLGIQSKEQHKNLVEELVKFKINIMGWGTDFKADLYLSRIIFTSIGEIEDKLKEYDESINNIEAEIKMYASSTPKDIIPDDYKDEPINWLTLRLNELYENYRESLINGFKLSLYLEYVEENKIDLLKENKKDEIPF
jgi:hypothetical protein